MAVGHNCIIEKKLSTSGRNIFFLFFFLLLKISHSHAFDQRVGRCVPEMFV